MNVYAYSKHPRSKNSSLSWRFCIFPGPLLTFFSYHPYLNICSYAGVCERIPIHMFLIYSSLCKYVLSSNKLVKKMQWLARRKDSIDLFLTSSNVFLLICSIASWSCIEWCFLSDSSPLFQALHAIFCTMHSQQDVFCHTGTHSWQRVRRLHHLLV